MARWRWRKKGSGEDVAATMPADVADVGRASRATTWQNAFANVGDADAVAYRTGNAQAIGAGAIAVTGVYKPTVQLPSEALRPPAEVDAPIGLNDLPYQPGLFVGRERELNLLDTALASPGTALVQAVAGLGGIGKSTLAAHWAATRPHGRVPVRWITADSPAAVQKGLADLATALQPVLAYALPVEALAEWGLQWLASHTGWLIVLDNVNDPADIAPLIARAPGGRFLITSRLATAWTDAATLVRLDILLPAESLALLTCITSGPHPGRDLDGAADLCETLGHLPLAIEQVAAYLAQNPLTTPRAYVHLLAQHPAQMYRAGAATTAASATIARVWNITLDRITRIQPHAADLLRTLAWYAPDHIPAVLHHAGTVDPPADSAALGLLTAYSMITPDPAANTLAIHRLVQALARTPDPEDCHRTPQLIDQAREQATQGLYTNLPEAWNTPDTWDTWRTLLPHIDAFATHTINTEGTINAARILNETALFLGNQGQSGPATTYFQRALTDTVRLLGEDHRSTLTYLNNLASAYEWSGDLERAIPMYEQSLTDTARVLGEDHPDTLTSRNNLAGAYESAGDLERALPLYEQTLDDRVRVLGEDDPATLTSRNNLAFAYESAGDPERAIPLYEQTLSDSVRILGEDHPSTLTYRNNLAYTYESAGDLGRAIPLYEQTLSDRVRVMGEDHPDTLTSRNNLAGAYESAGDLERAIPLYEQSLTDTERLWGEDHPSTLTYRHNLASTYESAGDPERAIALYEQTLVVRLRVLGEDHPDTLTSRNNLAYTYEMAGDLERAASLHGLTLSHRVRVLGEDHPDTLTSRNNLAHTHESAGDLERAIPLYEQTLRDTVRILGEGHPFTEMLRGNLARAITERDNVEPS
ncbi:tetratricopeptide repeat protein [Streptomyces sp. A0592]|uniref:tetratricopeptide repeat protein n=1 Tax=Streptomyces sp. A0592 TaxID=2563099 RepID=UPI0019CFFDE5|nr:tetratricopeptide repeat protein [Streptomyces sp. A0592]